MKYDERACKFNMDTGCVELLFRDGKKNFHRLHRGRKDALNVTMATADWNWTTLSTMTR